MFMIKPCLGHIIKIKNTIETIENTIIMTIKYTSINTDQENPSGDVGRDGRSIHKVDLSH